MKVSKHAILLAAIFLVTVALRLIIAYQSPTFEYEAYFHLRQGGHILSTGKPLFIDPLSYQGRLFPFPPVFTYLTAFLLWLFSPSIVVKVASQVLAAVIVIVIYFIAENLTHKKNVSLLCAFFAGFVPAFFAQTLNNLSPFVLVVPLFFLIMYFLININKKGYLYVLVGLLFVFVLSHAIAYVIVLALLIYLLLLRLESFRITAFELEILVLVTFLVFWVNSLLYKKAFLYHGFSIIWQNLPDTLLANFFQQFTYLQVIYLAGFVPLLLGVFGAYHILFREKKKSYLLVIAFGLALFIMLSFKLVALGVGLMFLSIVLIILSAHALEEIFSYLQKTRFSSLRLPVAVVIIVFFVATSLFQAFLTGFQNVHAGPTEGDVAALLWLRSHSRENTTVLAAVDEGFAVAYLADRRTVADNNFLMVRDSKERYEDIRKVFNSQFEIGALEILGKYDVEYIFLSENFLAGHEAPAFLGDARCFERLYEKEQRLYKVRCQLE